MTLLARVLGFGLDVLQALLQRDDMRTILAAAGPLTFGLLPKLHFQVARSRPEPMVNAVAEFVQDVGAREEGGDHGWFGREGAVRVTGVGAQ